MTVDPFAPAQLGPVTLRNRFVKAATFEGMTPKNVPTRRLIEYHRAVARGGVGLTTVAFCAIGVAVVVPRAGVTAPALDDLRAFAAERLAPHKLPEAIRFVDALPLTGMDKLDRRALAEQEKAGV